MYYLVSYKYSNSGLVFSKWIEETELEAFIDEIKPMVLDYHVNFTTRMEA